MDLQKCVFGLTCFETSDLHIQSCAHRSRIPLQPFLPGTQTVSSGLISNLHQITIKFG